jgi:hypothetical protein
LLVKKLSSHLLVKQRLSNQGLTIQLSSQLLVNSVKQQLIKQWAVKQERWSPQLLVKLLSNQLMQPLV